MKTTTSIIFFMLLCSKLMFAQSDSNKALSELPQKITVLELNNVKIKTDGILSNDEWNGAVNYPISENFEIYLIISSGNLYVGLKYKGDVANYKEALDCVSEIYITSKNEGEFYNLHSSARLAEEINKFSDNLKQAKYSIEEVRGWDANFGSPVQNNDLKWNGKEYKISLNKIASQSIRIAGGIIAVNFSFRKQANFPKGYGFQNSDNWVELILPNN